MHRRLLAPAALLLLAACGGAPDPTHETTALRSCDAALRERLDLPPGARTSQTQMIGQRPYGFLVRGLTVAAPATGARNYQCRLDGGSGPPVLTQVRLCAAGDSPWGCPGG